MSVLHLPWADLLSPGPMTGTLDVTSPYSGQILAQLPQIGREAIAEQVAASRAVADKRQPISIPERIAILESLQQALLIHQADLSMGIALEGGKPLADAQVEVARAADGVRSAVDGLRTDAGRVIPMNVNAASLGRVAFTQREPIGVVAAISAFNHPLNLIVHQVVPAVATGCPVIVKPAAETPLSCLRFVHLLREAGLPPEWCQVVMPGSHEDLAPLTQNSEIDAISFIGSAAVGWSIRQKAAPGTRVILEHGGVAPVIVAADANLDVAVPKLAKSSMTHAGQVCVSTQRIYVHEDCHDRFVDQFTKAVAALRVGDPSLLDTQVGPLIRAQDVRRVRAWLVDADAHGAKLTTGGRDMGNQCLEPAVVLEPGAGAKLLREEVFGPVAVVFETGNLDDAVNQANDVPFAFQAAVFTESLETAMRMSKRLAASAVMVNDHTAFRVDWMPFAGLKQSGLGVGGIQDSMHAMSYEKMVVLPDGSA